ncbi:hypothetical protein BD289DRAFT_438775 [Coniella lustricola]|uniref:Uncharacterized protein n=1 Tax=Coniella lustricola TaxID=2025994 RepID=A0A2T3A2G7_9PEZI|nr:hypothetical protein BD289DRAFT_438775 [Coniella lustricola]
MESLLLTLVGDYPHSLCTYNAQYTVIFDSRPLYCKLSFLFNVYIDRSSRIIHQLKGRLDHLLLLGILPHAILSPSKVQIISAHSHCNSTCAQSPTSRSNVFMIGHERPFIGQSHRLLPSPIFATPFVVLPRISARNVETFSRLHDPGCSQGCICILHNPPRVSEIPTSFI